MNTITEHIEKHHDKINCICEPCDYVPFGTTAIQEHKKRYNGDWKLDCESCDFITSSVKTYTNMKKLVILEVKKNVILVDF